jgi:crotonobetainyl-CoA:carnitine CoA-transferase CaiB-like acyl-CoA transferase
MEAPAWTDKDPNWFAHSRTEWERVYQPDRIAQMVREMADHIALLEQRTGRRFDEAKFHHLMEHDPQMAAREALVRLGHPLLGPFGHIATPIRFGRQRMQPFRAPAMGEHSHEIAREIAGLLPERIAELEAEGVFR